MTYKFGASNQSKVTDVASIEHAKFNAARHTVTDFMLGDFDVQGNYVIDQEIVHELIGLKKYFTDAFDNFELFHSELALDKQLTFLVTYEGERATLSLIEQVKFEGNFKPSAGRYSNINEYVLDVVETSGEINRSYLYTKWNISEMGDGVLDISNLSEEELALMYGLVSRYKYLLNANIQLAKHEQEIETVETNYLVRLNEVLSHYPKLNQAVQKEVKAIIKDNSEFIRLDEPSIAKTLNEVIVQVVENNADILTEKEKTEFEAEKHTVETEYNVAVEQVLPTQTEQVKADLSNQETESASQTENKVNDKSEKAEPDKNQTVVKIDVKTEEIEHANTSIADLKQELKTSQEQLHEQAQEKAAEALVEVKDPQLAEVVKQAKQTQTTNTQPTNETHTANQTAKKAAGQGNAHQQNKLKQTNPIVDIVKIYKDVQNNVAPQTQQRRKKLEQAARTAAATNATTQHNPAVSQTQTAQAGNVAGKGKGNSTAASGGSGGKGGGGNKPKKAKAAKANSTAASSTTSPTTTNTSTTSILARWNAGHSAAATPAPAPTPAPTPTSAPSPTTPNAETGSAVRVADVNTSEGVADVSLITQALINNETGAGVGGETSSVAKPSEVAANLTGSGDALNVPNSAITATVNIAVTPDSVLIAVAQVVGETGDNTLDTNV